MLQTTTLVTDEAGDVVSRFEYAPYGEIDAARSSGRDTVRAKYTGKEWDTDAGLYYYGARYYDP